MVGKILLQAPIQSLTRRISLLMLRFSVILMVKAKEHGTKLIFPVSAMFWGLCIFLSDCLVFKPKNPRTTVHPRPILSVLGQHVKIPSHRLRPKDNFGLGTATGNA